MAARKLTKSAAAHDATVHRFAVHEVDARGNVSRHPVEMGHNTVFSAAERLSVLERMHPGKKFAAHDRIGGGYIGSNGKTLPIKDAGSLREQAQKYSRLYHAALGRKDVRAARVLAVELSTHPGASKTEQRTFQSHRKTLEQGKLPYTAAQRSVLAPPAATTSLSQLKEAKAPRKPRSKVSTADDTSKVLDALHKQTAASPRSALHSMADVRKHSGLSKEAFDKAALQLQKEGKIGMHHHDLPQSVPADRRKHHVVGANGTEFHAVAAARPGPREPTLDSFKLAEHATGKPSNRLQGRNQEEAVKRARALGKMSPELRAATEEAIDRHDSKKSMAGMGAKLRALKAAKAGSASKASDVTSSHLRALHADIDKSERGRTTSEGFAESQKAKAFLDHARTAESRGHHEKAREMYQAYANKSAELARHPGLDRDMRRMNVNEAGEGLRGVGRMDKKIAEAHKSSPPAGYGAKLRTGQLARLKAAHAPGGVPIKSVKGDALERAYKTGKKGGRFYEVGGRRVYARKGK